MATTSTWTPPVTDISPLLCATEGCEDRAKTAITYEDSDKLVKVCQFHLDEALDTNRGETK